MTEVFCGLNLMLEFAVPGIVRSTLSSCYGNTFKLFELRVMMYILMQMCRER